MTDLSGLLAALDLEPSGDHQYLATHLDEGHGVVFGGQLLAQTVVAATRTVPDKELLSLHTVFARGGTYDEPLTIDVDVMASGRSMSSLTVTTSQRDRICTRSIALLHAPDEDRIRHADEAPDVEGPGGSTRRHGGPEFWDVRIVGDVDIVDPNLTGPAHLQVWSRIPGAPDELSLSQAMVAYASDGFLIATAMRPHAGIGQAMAHVSVATTVLTQTLTFHEPITAGDWLLFDQHSTYAGRGRSHGVAQVFDTSGTMVASFTQDNMIRAMA